MTPHDETTWFRSADALAEAVEGCVCAAEREDSKLTASVLAVPGMTSRPIRHLLNRLGGLPDCRFLEIGTFCGATVLAASYDNAGRFTAVDNFSVFREPDPRPRLVANLLKFRSHCQVTLHEIDCWKLPSLLDAGSVNIYFYDGDHARRAQTDALVRFAHAFTDPFVLLIDDWNCDEVQLGTRDALEQLGWSVQREWCRLTDHNGAVESWWNGLFVAVVQKRPSRTSKCVGLSHSG
jgi:hypothetical protein